MAGSLQEQVEAGLRQLFADCGDSEGPDADVLAYLAAGLAENDETDADELLDSLAGFSPAFGRLAPSKQQALVADLLALVARLRQPSTAGAAAGPAAGAAAAAAPPAKKASLAAVAAQALARLETLSVSSSAASSEAEGGSDEEGGGGPLSAAQRQAVASLRELAALPGACDTFLAHVLAAHGGGDVQAAAAWMLECDDLAGEQAAWQARRAERAVARAAARAEREAAKRQIVSRFQLQAVPNGGPAGGAAKGRPPALKPLGEGGPKGGAGENARKARFRDGVVVSTRGEKYVVEKVGEEWDGGSRGKVYSKGKRGKGFY